MKTPSNDIKRKLRNGFLLSSVLIIGFFQTGISQRSESKVVEKSEVAAKIKSKNALYITPIKAIFWERMNLGYEHALTDKLSLSADVQLWFLDKRPKVFIFENPNDRKVNTGSRYSLGARYYPSIRNKKTSMYLGGSIFYGSHHIIEKQAAENGFFSNDTDGREGEINLTSQGVKLSIGLCQNFKGGFFMDVGIDMGKAWINKDKNTLTLFPYESSKPQKEVNYSPIINGFFAEPMMAFGFKF